VSRQPASGLPASLETAWGLGRGQRRGPRPALTLERIVAAAVGLADAEGLGSVSMSRVAQELGVSTMALYRHLAAKDELVELMVDAALGDPGETHSADWRTGLAQWAFVLRDRLHEHPWALQVPLSGPPRTPNQLAFLEQGLRALGGTGLAEHEKASIVLLVSGYARSAAATTLDVEARFLAAAPTPDEAMFGYAQLLRRLVDPERFPALTALLAAGVFDVADDPGDEFVFGLERVLDGVAALIDARAGPRRRASPGDRASASHRR
jgi:AcrR family transcriptional regulator